MVLSPEINIGPTHHAEASHALRYIIVSLDTIRRELRKCNMSVTGHQIIQLRAVRALHVQRFYPQEKWIKYQHE